MEFMILNTSIGVYKLEEWYMITWTCFHQDEVDKETIHLLVFLFMQFLSQSEQAVIPGNIISGAF